MPAFVRNWGKTDDENVTETKCSTETLRLCPKNLLYKKNICGKSQVKVLTSVWNLLSQRYREVLIGLKGSKSILTFFSLPSSVTMVPQYTTKPLGGTGKREKKSEAI